MATIINMPVLSKTGIRPEILIDLMQSVMDWGTGQETG
jgi:hypothetical protein